MARDSRGGREAASRRSAGAAVVPPIEPPAVAAGAFETTGRYLVLLREDAGRAGVQALSGMGLAVASTADFADAIPTVAGLAGSQGVFFDKLDVAIVDTPPDQFRSLSVLAADENSILAIEPERIVHAIGLGGGRGGSIGGLTADYLLGYRDAIDHIADRAAGTGGRPAGGSLAGPAMFDESQATWGLQATKVVASAFSGKGISVAVLDTGFDLNHPDFVGRKIVSKSFIDGEEVQDGHGHGTHTIGTACGPKAPTRLPRYGVAYEATIFAGKVLSNQGSGSDGGILAGINWAVTNGCAVVSMSLGVPGCPPADTAFSQVFEAVAQRAMAAGTLIIAAAGNSSNRPLEICPVSHPANCPSILAVAAVDSDLLVAPFSCGGLNPDGGQVDVAGPGVDVLSSLPMPRQTGRLSGTSMATPHAAGIAALYAEANPTVRGRALANLLTQGALRLTEPSRDVGAGLVQAP